MGADPEGAAILDALHATRTTARERQTAMERQVGGGRGAVRQGRFRVGGLVGQGRGPRRAFLAPYGPCT